MDVCRLQRTGFAGLLLSIVSLLPGQPSAVQADSPTIHFDLPAVVSASERSAGVGREVTIDIAVSSLVDGPISASGTQTPPIDHMLIRCRLRDRLPVVDYEPRTELQSDFASPISVTAKDEQSDSVGLSVDANYAPFGLGHFGADESRKRSDSTQFQRQAPMQAVIASGTTQRGRGVYFKLRWTAQQVLEGEKRFQVTFAVPATWRGGLMDIDISAHAVDRSLFGSARPKVIQRREFVVAVHQSADPAAAETALRLAKLDRLLAGYALRDGGDELDGIKIWWRKLLRLDHEREWDQNWYRQVTHSPMGASVDESLDSLPKSIRVAVLHYAEASRELMQSGK